MRIFTFIKLNSANCLHLVNDLKHHLYGLTLLIHRKERRRWRRRRGRKKTNKLNVSKVENFQSVAIYMGNKIVNLRRSKWNFPIWRSLPTYIHFVLSFYGLLQLIISTTTTLLLLQLRILLLLLQILSTCFFASSLLKYPSFSFSLLRIHTLVLSTLNSILSQTTTFLINEKYQNVHSSFYNWKIF